MAVLGTKISQLPDGVDLLPTDLIPIARDADNKKIKADIIATKVHVAAAIAAAPTNLSNILDTTTVQVSSSTGTSTTLPAATPTTAGVMTAADKIKLESAITSIPLTNKTWSQLKIGSTSANGKRWYDFEC